MPSTTVFALDEYLLYKSIMQNVQDPDSDTPQTIGNILRKVGTYVSNSTIILVDNALESEVNPIDTLLEVLQSVFGNPNCGLWSNALLNGRVKRTECISRASAHDILADLNFLQKKGK